MKKRIKRPRRLNKHIDFKKCRELDKLFEGLRLNTVCRQAFCPNLSECFESGVAAFLILGKHCTRSCRFCAVAKGAPGIVDEDEPARVALAAARLALKHVVITSVTRDDLDDGGASIFARCIDEIRAKARGCAIEVLVPDFNGREESLFCVVKKAPSVFSHNIETVPSLYSKVRAGADYQRSLNLLRLARRMGQSEIKSGLMLGLGESRDEVIESLKDLRACGCNLLSIGQYLAPSQEHLQVKE